LFLNSSYFIQNEAFKLNASMQEKKVKLPMLLINYASQHEDVWGNGGTAPPFLITALDGDEWSASRSGYPMVTVSPRVKQPGSDAHHLPPTSEEVKNGSYTSTPPCLYGIVPT
jgi:hypothetical protein